MGTTACCLWPLFTMFTVYLSKKWLTQITALGDGVVKSARFRSTNFTHSLLMCGSCGKRNTLFPVAGLLLQNWTTQKLGILISAMKWESCDAKWPASHGKAHAMKMRPQLTPSRDVITHLWKLKKFSLETVNLATKSNISSFIAVHEKY